MTELIKLQDTVQEQQVTDFLTLNYENIIDQFDCHPKTRDKYKSDAKPFISFIAEHGLNVNTFRQYKKHLAGIDSIKVGTKAVKLTAAKRLLQELHGRYRLLTVDLTAGTKSFQVSAEHVKEGLSRSEVQAVKKVINKEPDALKRTRFQAMFALLAVQGLRQFEVAALTLEDLRLEDRTALIKGKGRDDKERIDLHPDTVQAIREYLMESGKKSGYLFTSISRAAKGNNALTERAIRKMFTDIFRKAGLPEGRSVHGLRHFFVTRMLEATSGDLLTVQKFSRHKSLNTIRCYDDRQRKKDLLPAYYQAFN